MKNIIALLTFSVCLAGCNIYDIDEILLQKEVISLSIKGTDTIIYSPDRYQLSYNAEKNEFRVFDDNMAQWFSLTCDSRPSTVGQVVKADLKWTSPNSTKTRNALTFRVQKTDSGGLIWMWCESDAIGVIVKEL